MDARRFAPATERNREPIVAVLERVLPRSGLVLEVASGSGEHAVFFAARLPGLEWQPSDLDAANLASIAAWRAHAKIANVRAPIALDAAADEWSVDRADAIVSINMIHIAPWATCLGLLRGAALRLAPAAPLVLYGPFRREGKHTAPSNEAFDQGLRAQNPAWGVRNLEDVCAAAAERGLALDEVVQMPSNNLTVILRRVTDATD
jgi:hypothetical protein